MSRRNPGAASAMGVGLPGNAWRQRLAVPGMPDACRRHVADPGAVQASQSDAGREARRSSGLLEMEVPAPGLPIPVPPPDSVGAERRRRSGDAGQHSGGLPGHRRDGARALSARVRVQDRGTGGGAAGCPRGRAGRLLLVAGRHRGRPGGPAQRVGACRGGGIRSGGREPPARRRETRPARGRKVSRCMLPVPWQSRGWFSCPRAAGFTRRSQPPAGPRTWRSRTGSTLQPCWRMARRSWCRSAANPIRPACPATGAPLRRVRAPSGTSPGSGGGKINLNTAGVEELGTLPRVGPVLAQRIVDWRQQHGRFKTVQELDAVDGIGPKLLEALLPLVGV